MKFINLSALIAAFLLQTVSSAEHQEFNTYLQSQNGLQVSPAIRKKVEEFRELFVSWKRNHGKIYQTVEEELHRMLLWIENHEFIATHNEKSTSSYTVAHNAFSDLTNDEFNKIHALGKYSIGAESLKVKLAEQKAMHKLDPEDSLQQEFRYLRELASKSDEKWSIDDWLNVDDAVPSDDNSKETDDSEDDNDHDGLPDSIDWVEAGAVTPVKNQGSCGSCWAFSSTGAIEGAHFIKTGELVSLSEQNLMDCDTLDNACEGGLMEQAFKFEESANGLCSEDDYPYLATDDSVCNNDCAKVESTIVKDYIDIEAGDKHGLLASIILQPTSIAMEAGGLGFQFYSTGVFDDDSCGEDGSIDHGVLAVGYGHDEDSKHDFIKVKNSWGDSWGEGGYFRIKRHSKNAYGTCSVYAYMTAPILA
jgi:C1A family cysteine protease